MHDPHDLQRFVTAQDGVFDAVERELRAGAKASHWMWFVFPQVGGLGSSPTAQRYAIASRAEAQAYYADAVLGGRLRRCTDWVLATRNRSARAIFGQPDDMKFRSSMTLFAQAAAQDGRFQSALDRFFGGEPDPRTLELL